MNQNDEQIRILDESEDKQMLWETVGKPAYERGLLEGRQEAGLFAVIPMSILESKTLSANAKLLYGEIMALSKKNGQCYATNEYLAEMIGLSKRSMPQLLKELSGTGLILVDIQRSEKGTYRYITVSFFNEGGYSSMTKGGIVNGRGQKRNRQREIDKVDIISEQSSQNKEIPKLIDLFKKINPAYQKLFGNKTQRAALTRLLEKTTADKLAEIILVVQETNKQPYAPIITTPLQLEEKMGSLTAFLQRNANKASHASIVL